MAPLPLPLGLLRIFWVGSSLPIARTFDEPLAESEFALASVCLQT